MASSSSQESILLRSIKPDNRSPGLRERNPRRSMVVVLILHAMFIVQLPAAEVIFLNGDRLNGRILSVADGELVLETDGAGEVTIDLKKVKTFSSDEPLKIRVGDSNPFDSKIVAGSAGKIEAQRTPGVSPQPMPIKDITSINEPMPAWEGGVSISGMLTRGNTERIEGGITFELQKDWENDHLSFGGEYFYGREKGDSGDKSTTDDYGEGFAKYERDIHDKLYVEGEFKVQHDSLAELEYRLTPNVGLGYRWFEDPHFTFYTELGIAYTYERYDTFGSREYFGPMLEYGLEWRPIKPLEIFHSLEFYPSFSDLSGNYLINAKAGIHATVWKGLFVELRVEYHYDSEPAASAKEGDLRVIIGPGWEF